MAVDEHGKCLRCHEVFGNAEKCQECGVHRDRRVQVHKRRRPATGKRGRNSGTVGTAKKKS